MPEEQLRDVIVSIASVEDGDGGEKYAGTRVFRYDLEKPIDDFIKYLEKYPGLIEGGPMKNLDKDGK